MMKAMYWTANKETGTFIEAFETIEEARDAILAYEKEDVENGCYTNDFYEVVDENHCRIG